MLVVHHPEKIPPFPGAKSMTIGSFDGVHLGHQHRINIQRADVGKEGTVAVFTFSNHPSEVFDRPKPIISSLDHKLQLLKKYGVNLVVLQRFTPCLAETPYDDFLRRIHYYFPFQTLVQGKGDKFGKGRQGGEVQVKQLADILHFKSLYLSKIAIDRGSCKTSVLQEIDDFDASFQSQHTGSCRADETIPDRVGEEARRKLASKERFLAGREFCNCLDKETISSTKIRAYIKKGDLSSASKLLGRPYSLLLRFERGQHFDMRSLCTPPEGRYTAEIRGGTASFIAPVSFRSLFLTIEDERLQEIPLGSLIEIIFTSAN